MTAEKKVVKKIPTSRAATKTMINNLKAFAMDDGGSRFVVLCLTDPHLLEGGERGQDGTTDPDGVLSLWGSNDLDLHCAGRKGGDFLLHAISNTRVHGGTAGQDGVGVQVLTDINVALHDRIVRVSWIPHDSIPMKLGWNRASGQRNRSLPMVMT